MVWGDVATATFHEASLTESNSPYSAPQPPSTITSTTFSSSSVSPAASLLALSRRLVRGGLTLEPTSDWLWAAAGTVAGEDDPAPREYCWSRALQLNPRRAATWAALGRMYAQDGSGVGTCVN